MDVVDRAQIEMENLAKHQAFKPVLITRKSATHCNDCCEPIPKARQAAVKGVQFCIDCQALLENGQREKRQK